ncbi:MAG: phosphoribosylaminoimidazolesuccinocarboxamide synthase, partial [Candidatus Competibacterales bacterium]
MPQAMTPPSPQPPPLPLTRVGGGKVRDLYHLDDQHWLMVASDRLSAFDVVLPTPIPGKGAVLTALSEYWFQTTGQVVANHRQGVDVDLAHHLAPLIQDRNQYLDLLGRSMAVRRATPLPVEAVVRGYLSGSAWRDYRRSGTVAGIPLPSGLRQADPLPAPMFTPTTKAPPGQHDQPLTFDQLAAAIGFERAEALRAASLALYDQAARRARPRGIIIADSKFEFGVAEDGQLLLIDELLTPDSSRFWDSASHRPGETPASFDKQFVRDYLESVGCDKRPPAPVHPEAKLRQNAAPYP